MGRGIEWVVTVELKSGKKITKVYKHEREAVAALGFRTGQLTDILRGKYKKLSQGMEIIKRQVVA